MDDSQGVMDESQQVVDELDEVEVDIQTKLQLLDAKKAKVSHDIEEKRKYLNTRKRKRDAIEKELEELAQVEAVSNNFMLKCVL